MSIGSRPYQKGYTLLEIMLSLGLALFLSGIALYIYMAMSTSYLQMLSINRLEEQLRTAMDKMVQDITRAGYSAGAINSVHTGTNSNAFMASESDLSIPNSSCILFTYDSDSTGMLPALNTVDYDKRYGFRLFNSSIQSRPLTDSSFSCTSGTWHDLTDNNVVQVTALTFTPNNTSVALGGTSTLLIRNVTISITAQLTGDSNISKTMTQTIRVRNDKYQP